MAVENHLVAEPAQGRPWLTFQGPRSLASIGFLVLHLAGGAYALTTALNPLILLGAARLLVTQSVLFRIFARVWLLIPLGLASVVVLAAIETSRTLRRWRQREPEPDVGLRVRVLAYVALACVFVNAFFLSTPETFAGPFRLRYPILANITAVFAYGAYDVWSMLLPRLRRVFPPRLGRGLDVLALNVALLLVLSEVSLRILAAFWPSPLLVTKSSTSEIRRNAERQPPGTLLFGFPVNSGGHYDTEFVPRTAGSNQLVVWIGDSFSYGAVPHYYHFTQVAERALPGVTVYNMGYPGLGPSDYLYLLQHEALPLHADLVVVELFIGNDVVEGPKPGGPARWYDADSYLLAIVWYRLQIMKRAKLVDTEVRGSSRYFTPDRLRTVFPFLDNPLLERPSASKELFFAIETSEATAMCLPHEGLYDPFFKTLAEIKRAAGDVPLAFMVIPDEFQIEDDIWKEVVREVGQPLDRDLSQRTIVPWLRARGQAFVDLLPLMRAVPPMSDGRRHLYHRQNLHFNARGNEVAGRALARLVDSLLPRTGRPAPPPAAPLVPPPPPPLPRVSLPLHVDVGEASGRSWMAGGWQESEASGGRSYTWNDGMPSVLIVPLPKGRDIRMDFEALPFEFPRSPEQRVSIVLNGKVVEEIALRSGLAKYSVILPAAALVNAPDTLEFRYAYARMPQDVIKGSPDMRALAVAWYTIDFAAQHP